MNRNNPWLSLYQYMLTKAAIGFHFDCSGKPSEDLQAMSAVAERLRGNIGRLVMKPCSTRGVRGGVQLSMGAPRLEAVPSSKLAEQRQHRLDKNDFASKRAIGRNFL